MRIETAREYHQDVHTGAARWLGLAGWLVVTFIAAFVGSRFQPGTWYAALAKPAWTPPSAVFGPVWTILYIMMATAAWLVWSRFGVRGARTALTLYLAQLALNTAWSWLFFGLHRIDLALVDIALLWVLIALTLYAFWLRRPLAGALLLPYLLWVSYASALNFAILRLNS